MQYTLTGVSRNDGAYGRTVSGMATGLDGTKLAKVTIYEKQKDGSTFPGFEAIEEGSVVEGNAWTNPKGYVTIFPPKPAGAPAPRRSPAAMDKAMEKKAAYIATAQGNKEEGIKISSTMRDAVAIVVSMNTKGTMNGFQIEQEITKWRQWLWLHWDDPSDYPPFE